MKVVITGQAEAEIRAIGLHIERDDPSAAGRWLAATTKLCLSLHENVERAPVVGRRRGVAIRRLVHGAYLVLYSVDGDVVRIHRVTHGARSPNALLKGLPQA